MREKHIESYPILENSTLNYKGIDIDVLDLYLRFENSEYGQFQAKQQPRFHKVHPIGDYETHVNLLGDDVHPVKHMLFTTADLAIPSTNTQVKSLNGLKLDRNERTALVVTSMIHDVDECEHPKIHEAMGFVVGDLPSFEVTADDEAKKKLIRQEHINPLFYTDLPDELLYETEGIISHRGKGLTPELFKYIEKVGYLTTAIKASKLAVEIALSELSDKTYLFDLINLSTGVREKNKDVTSKTLKRFPFLSSVFSQMQCEFAQADSLLEQSGVV